MSSRRARGSVKASLEDMLQSCQKIRTYLEGVNLKDYLGSSMRRDAVERQLQILTEAAYRLGMEAPRLCPEIDWREIRGLGNFLRHEYDNVNPEMIWSTLHEDLPRVELAVKRALATSEFQDVLP